MNHNSCNESTNQNNTMLLLPLHVEIPLFQGLQVTLHSLLEQPFVQK